MRKKSLKIGGLVMKYLLNLNEEQVTILIKALDLYSRIGMGQFKEVLGWQFGWQNNSIPHEDYQDIIERLDYIKFMLSGGDLSPGSYRGICSPETPESCKVAYDIQQVVRNSQAWVNNPNGDITVAFDSPLKVSQQPLPICEAVASLTRMVP